MIYDYVFYYISHFNIAPQYVLNMTISDVETYIIKSEEQIGRRVQSIKKLQRKEIPTNFNIDISKFI